MQHIEDAGVHSGDSACVLPPYLIGDRQVDEMRRHTQAFAKALGVVGLINVAVRHQERRCLRAGGQPAGVADRAVREQGHRVPLAKLAAAGHRRRTLDDLAFPMSFPSPG